MEGICNRRIATITQTLMPRSTLLDTAARRRRAGRAPCSFLSKAEAQQPCTRWDGFVRLSAVQCKIMAGQLPVPDTAPLTSADSAAEKVSSLLQAISKSLSRVTVDAPYEVWLRGRATNIIHFALVRVP